MAVTVDLAIFCIRVGGDWRNEGKMDVTNRSLDRLGAMGDWIAAPSEIALSTVMKVPTLSLKSMPEDAYVAPLAFLTMHFRLEVTHLSTRCSCIQCPFALWNSFVDLWKEALYRWRGLHPSLRESWFDA
jgi:hypothetical protein